jgi:hypothetical protein
MDTEIGDISRVTIFYYDDDELLNDALYSEATINDTYNIHAVHNLSIGWTNTFVIKSYHAQGAPKIYDPKKST